MSPASSDPLRKGLAQLLLLAVAGAALLALVGTLASIWQGRQLEVATVGAEALRAQGQIDMMHDAIRADALSYLSGDATQSRLDYARHKESLISNLTALEGLPLERGVKRSVGTVRSSLGPFLASADELMKSGGLVASDRKEAFYRQWRNLEPRLAGFSDQIDKSISKRAQEGRETNSAALLLLVATLLVTIGGILLTARRISGNILEANEQLRASQSQARVALQAKTDFLASMSHEIRTPLNSIIGFTDVLLEDQSLDERQRRQVSLVHNSGNALLSVINDILDFSKIEAGKIDLHVEPFATEALIDNSVSITRSSAEAKGLSLNVEQDPRLAKYYVGDEHRLRQVLLNLLNNAIKFTHTGTVTLSVAVEGTGSRADALRFSVHDTGEGIPEDKQHRLFQSFSQADSTVTKRHGGTGLGLAISKRLIEAMGGTIGLESKEGEGSTFWFAVPLVRADALSEPVAEPRPLKAIRSARVLLAEDIPVNQELACAILGKDGHQVDVVDDGEDAVKAARTGIYDLVLMDIQMPKMDGVTATKLIRALPAPAGKVPIIAMTANVLPEQVKQFLAAGMDDHVGKPIKQVELKAAINRALKSASGTDHAQPAAAGLATFDAETFDKIRALLPPERLRTHLENFDRQLADLCEAGEPAEGVAQVAHKLVSQAGMFGFMRLSEKCRELEQACRDGVAIAQELQDTCLAAVEAKKQVAELLRAP